MDHSPGPQLRGKQNWGRQMMFLRSVAGYRRTCGTIRQELNLFIILDKIQSFEMRQKHAALMV